MYRMLSIDTACESWEKGVMLSLQLLGASRSIVVLRCILVLKELRRTYKILFKSIVSVVLEQFVVRFLPCVGRLRILAIVRYTRVAPSCIRPTRCCFANIVCAINGTMVSPQNWLHG